MVVSAVFSAAVTDSFHVDLTCTQLLAYVQWKDVSGGFHLSGLLSPFSWLTLSVTAHSSGDEMSLAN